MTRSSALVTLTLFGSQHQQMNINCWKQRRAEIRMSVSHCECDCTFVAPICRLSPYCLTWLVAKEVSGIMSLLWGIRKVRISGPKPCPCDWSSPSFRFNLLVFIWLVGISLLSRITLFCANVHHSPCLFVMPTCRVEERKVPSKWRKYCRKEWQWNKQQSRIWNIFLS